MPTTTRSGHAERHAKRAATVTLPNLPAAPAGPSDLEIRAAERRAYLAVRAVPCPEHHAAADRPCWTHDSRPDEGEGVCGMRVFAFRRIVARQAERTGELARRWRATQSGTQSGDLP